MIPDSITFTLLASQASKKLIRSIKITQDLRLRSSTFPRWLMRIMTCSRTKNQPTATWWWNRIRRLILLSKKKIAKTCQLTYRTTRQTVQTSLWGQNKRPDATSAKIPSTSCRKEKRQCKDIESSRRNSSKPTKMSTFFSNHLCLKHPGMA